MHCSLDIINMWEKKNKQKTKTKNKKKTTEYVYKVYLIYKKFKWYLFFLNNIKCSLTD